MRSILFVSAVNSWAGSEIMWTEIAASLAEKGYDITFAIRYKNPVIQKMQKKLRPLEKQKHIMAWGSMKKR